MPISLISVIAATPTPTPQQTLSFENSGPGFLGFVFTAAVVALTILLMLNMTRKLRRVRYNEQVRQEFEGVDEPDPRRRKHVIIPVRKDGEDR